MKLMRRKTPHYFIRNLLFIFITFLFFTSTVLAQLRIGSFNTRHLGGSEIKDLYGMAKIINGEEFSIVALQEVSSEEGIRELVNYLGSGWDYKVMSGNCNGECFAFIWRGDKKISLESSTLWQKDTPIKRPPFIAGFRNGTKLFWLINVHIVYGKTVAQRDLEIQELKTIYSSVNRTQRYSSVNQTQYYTIMLGDFNRESEMINKKGLPFKSYQNSKTTLKKVEKGYNNSYDHFCFNERIFNDLKPKFVRVKAPEKYYRGNFEKYQQKISDHVPIRMDIEGDTNLFETTKEKIKGFLNIGHSE